MTMKSMTHTGLGPCDLRKPDRGRRVLWWWGVSRWSDGVEMLETWSDGDHICTIRVRRSTVGSTVDYRPSVALAFDESSRLQRSHRHVAARPECRGLRLSNGRHGARASANATDGGCGGRVRGHHRQATELAALTRPMDEDLSNSNVRIAGMCPAGPGGMGYPEPP